MKRKAITLLAKFIPCIFAACLVGCTGDSADSSSTETPKKTIGFSLKDASNPFFKVIADSLSAEAAKSGYDVIVVNGADDLQTQQNQIKDFIAKGCAAIVLNPVDSKSIGSAIKEANDADIPVFTCDLKCTADGVKIAGHVATDNYQGGRLAGDAMVELLGKTGGDVLVLDFKVAESCIERVRGFKDVLNAHNTANPTAAITVVAELPCEGKMEPGRNSTMAALESKKGLKAIFAINDPAALGAYAAIESAGLTDQIKIVGFDGEKAGKEAIRDGKIYADPIQFPDKMGVLTMQNIVKYFAGEDFEAETLLPSSLYKKEDADKDPALAK